MKTTTRPRSEEEVAASDFPPLLSHRSYGGASAASDRSIDSLKAMPAVESISAPSFGRPVQRPEPSVFGLEDGLDDAFGTDNESAEDYDGSFDSVDMDALWDGPSAVAA